jgi:hypothetical protein
MNMTQPDPRTDERLEKLETIRIPWSEYKKALARNYLGESNRHDRSFMLRLYPPFEPTMTAEYYESEQGRHYNNEWDEKPFHIHPELLILEGDGGSFRSIVNYPEEHEIRNALTEEEIEAEGGIDAAMENAKEMFWEELKTILPERFNLGVVQGHMNYPVDVEWVFDDEE